MEKEKAIHKMHSVVWVNLNTGEINEVTLWKRAYNSLREQHNAGGAVQILNHKEVSWGDL